MTRNQLSFQENLETNRHNLATESENYRSNLAHERETHRANLAQEAETFRANRAREDETHRQNREVNAINRYANTTSRMQAQTSRLSAYNQNAYWQGQLANQRRQAQASLIQAKAALTQASNTGRYQTAMSTAALSQADTAALQARQRYSLGMQELSEAARRNDLTYDVALQNAATNRANIVNQERMINQNIIESRVRTQYVPLNAFTNMVNAASGVIRSTSQLVQGGISYGK